MKKLLGAILLLFFVLTNYAQAYEVNRYMGVKVHHIKWLCEHDYGGCYFYAWPFKGEINMNPHDSEDHYIDTLNHEVWHQFWFERMTETERQLYIAIEAWRYDSVLESKWILMWQCNVSDYATTDVREDFAEVFMFYMADKYRKTLEDKCDLKTRLVEYFYNKYK